ncbi:reverse transcriptase domain-containing protein [Sorangium sp. So ce1504]|uniref:reverse transcriptase domain-containing protein n=1 Tax=Sorangium sp. So ce1504 TaxID=3133337 RepID=UPI003F602F0D
MTIDDGIPVEEHEPLWLLIEWPFGESDPSKFAVTTLGTKMSKKQIVRQYKERYRTEQAYEEMKGELGLDHFEGRRFRGWHHHVSVVLCCYAFIVAERDRSFFPRQTPKVTPTRSASRPERHFADSLATVRRAIARALIAWLPLLPSRLFDGRKIRLCDGHHRAGSPLTAIAARRCGTPQGGVASPLLANIYMHRFIKAFRMHGLATKYRAELVTYADDFVVLCGGNARKVLDIVRQWMTRIGLTINEAKTSVRDARREHFDFLGYTFGPLHSPRTRGKYNGARPSNKAVARLREAVRARLRPGNQAVIADVVKALNRVLRGWANYFCYGSRTRARHAMDLHVEERMRAFLRRRHKVAGRGCRQFPKEKIFGELGVLSMEHLP